MLNRRHIRVKVMQMIYAFKNSESDDLKVPSKFLNGSLEDMYNLYILIMSLIIEIQAKAEDYQNKSQKKHLATTEEKNPNTKFVNNQLLLQLKNNSLLTEAIENRKPNDWKLDNKYVDILFKAVLESEDYKNYMQSEKPSFNEDKAFVLNIFKNIIAPNEKLYEYLEDYKLTWLDDLPVVNTAIVRLLKKAKKDTAETHFVPDLYKDEEDKKFAHDLFTKTILNQIAYVEEIKKSTNNWDTDRIAQIDATLLKMAICELKKFPSIPAKVTINEYLEIAKEYSTPKSSTFINGILDRLVKDYTKEGTLNKIGRGLM